MKRYSTVHACLRLSLDYCSLSAIQPAESCDEEVDSYRQGSLD